MEETIVELGTDDLHKIGKLETALEGPLSDALMQELALRFALLGLLAGDAERVLFYFDGDVVLAETGNRHGDAIFVFADALDIIGRVGRNLEASGIVEKLAQAVEADGRTI